MDGVQNRFRGGIKTAAMQASFACSASNVFSFALPLSPLCQGGPIVFVPCDTMV